MTRMQNKQSESSHSILFKQKEICINKSDVMLPFTYFNFKQYDC